MFSCLLSNTLLAGVAALLVWGVARWLRPTPATLHALWLVVMLKLLSPFGLLYPLPLAVDLGGRASPPAGPAAVAPVEVSETFFLAELPADAVGEETVTVSEPSPAPTRQTAAGLLLALWVAGAVAVAARQAWHTGRFAWRARGARQAPEAVARHAERLARQLGVRPPSVRVLAGLLSPAVWALGRPVLLWPAGLERRLGDGGRDAVLLHELAHLRRGDHWTRWLELVAAVVHWWNPLFWLARRQVRFHAELACDAWVTGTLPAARRAYAEALLEVCSTVSRASVAPAVGVGGDGRRDFQRRLTMIMREKVPCRLSGRGKLAAAFLAATLLPGWVFAQGGDPTPKPTEGEKPPALEAEVVLGDAPADGGREQKLKELEARIAELTRELKALRGDKAEPVRKVVIVSPDGQKVPGDVHYSKAAGPVRVIVIDSATGRVVKEVNQATPPADVLKHVDELKRAESARAAAVDKAVQGRIEAVRVLDFARHGSVPDGASAQAVLLSRATYKLPREKAEALSAFIKQHVQAKVLELKSEGDGLTVTTTPEVQRAIGTLINLMQGGPAAGPHGAEGGKPTGYRIELHSDDAVKPLDLKKVELLPEGLKQIQVELKSEALKPLRLNVKPEALKPTTAPAQVEIKLNNPGVPPGFKPAPPGP